MELSKGDIVLVEAPFKTVGTEQQKTRPAVVLSPREMSIFARRVVIAPCTSNTSKIYPYEFLISDKSLPKRSKASCDQVQTVSVQRILKKYGHISKKEMQALDCALRVIFQL